MWSKQNRAFSSLNDKNLKLVDQLTYFGRNISSTENDGKMRIGKAGTATHRLSIIWKSDLSDKITWEFFQSISTIVWFHHQKSNRILGEKARWKLYEDVAYSFEHILEAASDKNSSSTAWNYLRGTRNGGHWWKSRDEPIRNIIQWTSKDRHTSVQPTSKVLHSSALCGQLMQSTEIANSNSR